jgi:anti-anti-sigma regulatory factor
MATTEVPGGIRAESRDLSVRRLRPEISPDFGFVVVHETGRGTVAWVRGDIDISTAPMLLRQVIETMDLPLDTLTLDLAEVVDIDEHGFAALQVANKRATMRGVTLRFGGLDEEARTLLERSK